MIIFSVWLRRGVRFFCIVLLWWVLLCGIVRFIGVMLRILWFWMLCCVVMIVIGWSSCCWILMYVWLVSFIMGIFCVMYFIRIILCVRVKICW